MLTSGYWSLLCTDIATSWRTCEAGSDENKEKADAIEFLIEVNPCSTGAGTSQEDDGEQTEKCNVIREENECRNDVLEYLAWFRGTETVFEALAENNYFRGQLLEKCDLLFRISDDYDVFNVKYDLDNATDDLKEALDFEPPREWLEDEESDT